MELNQIIELIKAVNQSNLTDFKLDQDGVKISMKTDKRQNVIMTAAAPAAMPVQAAAPMAAPAAPTAQVEAEEETMTGNVISSPLVGTYYNAPNPDAEPFVQVGDTVKKGQTIGIVEAMKLMNEIESEFDGVVKQILVGNEEVVEYGQPLFVIE